MLRIEAWQEDADLYGISEKDTKSYGVRMW
jgi:hypothetical protein